MTDRLIDSQNCGHLPVVVVVNIVTCPLRQVALWKNWHIPKEMNVCLLGKYVYQTAKCLTLWIVELCMNAWLPNAWRSKLRSGSKTYVTLIPYYFNYILKYDLINFIYLNNSKAHLFYCWVLVVIKIEWHIKNHAILNIISTYIYIIYFS